MPILSACFALSSAESRNETRGTEGVEHEGEPLSSARWQQSGLRPRVGRYATCAASDGPAVALVTPIYMMLQYLGLVGTQLGIASA